MSVVDSQADIEAARTRLTQVDDVDLTNDLRYWTVEAFDADVDYRELHERLADIRLRHSEASTWVGLIAHELRARRDTRRAPTTD